MAGIRTARNRIPTVRCVRQHFEDPGQPGRILEFDTLLCVADRWPERPEARDPAWNVVRVGRLVQATRLNA